MTAALLGDEESCAGEGNGSNCKSNGGCFSGLGVAACGGEGSVALCGCVSCCVSGCSSEGSNRRLQAGHRLVGCILLCVDIVVDSFRRCFGCVESCEIRFGVC